MATDDRISGHSIPQNAPDSLSGRRAAGAQSNSVIYSLIETEKENKLDPYCYLLWVLENATILAQESGSLIEALVLATLLMNVRHLEKRMTASVITGMAVILYAVDFDGYQ